MDGWKDGYMFGWMDGFSGAVNILSNKQLTPMEAKK
jgi:hypothetical protein